MEPIKKKMLSMRSERDAAIDKNEQLETKLKEVEEAKSKVEEEVSNLQKKLSKVENDFDTANEALQEATTKLEASEKQVAEQHPGAGGTNELDDVIMPYLECNARNPRRKPCTRGLRLCQELDCAPLQRSKFICRLL
ncbi:tropomyosin [Elysia marginata]|uniref:Tropomyosin n=1 Tax=Elysia marginata TaxID=1093978 RepID=A0AAV4FEE8_9GAST|nr:tropomyosin [Elysia marginata]